MLIQSSVTRSIEAALSIAPDHGDRDFLCDWMPAGEAWHKCSKCSNLPHNICGQAVRAAEEEKDENYCHPLSFQNCSQLSTVSTMSENSTPTIVYHRKKVRQNSITPAQVSTNRKASNGCFSGSSSTVPSVFANENMVSLAEIGNEAVRVPAGLPFERNMGALVSKSDSFTGFTVGDEPGSEDAPTSGTHKVLLLCCMNDTCSSSKSNVDLDSTSSKPEVDDTAECSSSGALAIGGLKDNMSEKEVCVSILRSFGSLGRIWPIKTSPSAEGTCPVDDTYCSQSCKVCDRSDATLKMLICDNCDEAFHLSCCNPRVKKIPDDEWFCHSCLKKKHKILKEKVDTGRCKNATSGGQSSPIISMLKGMQPYLPGVRIGEEYQAEIPDWSGPILNEIDPCSKPLELNPVEYASINGTSSKQPSRFSSIGNWLQCREVIEAAEGTVCGKWRRAPLFEVQTDDWECFRSVLWDPPHADCAVPQELDTDEVLRQLKYIEMLRPRLAAKKRKLDCAKSNGSQELTADVRNTQS